MASRITGISSMATRALLAELARAYEARSGWAVAIESVGGVDAAKRVQDGEAFDVVVLASDALAKLVDAGRVMAGSVVDLVHSGVAVAMKAGAPRNSSATGPIASRRVNCRTPPRRAPRARSATSSSRCASGWTRSTTSTT